MAISNALGFWAAMLLAASAVIVPTPSIAETEGRNFLVLPGEICMASNGAPFLVEVKKEVGTGRIALRLAKSENWSAASSAAHQVMSEDHLYVFRGRSDFVFTRLDLDGKIEMGGCRAIDLIYRELELRAILEATASMEANFADVLDEKQIIKDELDSALSENLTLEQNTRLLESRLSETSSELSALKLTAENLRIQAQEQNAELASIKGELTRLKAQLTVALAARNRAETELERATVEIDALRAVNTQLTQETQASTTDALSDALSAETIEMGKASAGRNPLMDLTNAELDTFRREVMQCWMIDPGSAASRVSLVVSFDMTPEGKPISDSIFLVSFDGVDIEAVERAFQSARRAILRCGAKGYTLPTTKYESWKTVELSFVPF